VPDDTKRVSEGWAAAHAAYHAALTGACDSPWLLRLRELLFAQSERYRRLSVPMADVDRDLDREHRDLMEAVLARDVARAKSLIAQHLALTASILLQQEWPTPMAAPSRRANG
jgi:DNA-binding GntR family transcriptional regulator